MQNLKNGWLLMVCFACFVLTLCTIPALGCASDAEEKIDSSGEWRYVLTDNGAKVSGYKNQASGTLTIPSTVDGHPVVEIGDEAFLKCEGLIAVEIPQGVVSIGTKAFRECTGLTDVTIPDSVTHLGEGAFARCYSLTAVEIPKSVSTMGMNPFYGCPLSLFTVSADNEAYVVVDDVLFDKEKETLISYPSAKKGSNYSIPKGTLTIASGAFLLADEIESVEIPDSVTNIGSSAFEQCNGLSYISIPDSVLSIGERAFSGCANLTDITIPSGVASIGYRAFYGCINLIKEYDECTRSSPLNKGEMVTFILTRDGNEIETYLTLTDVCRGNAALQKLREVRPFYDAPSNGKEYMVGEFFVSVTCKNDSVSREFSYHNFDAVSASGRKYQTRYISNLDCSIDLFSGGSGTFYVPVEINIDEDMYYLFLDTVWISTK